MNLERKIARFYKNTMPIPESGCLIWMRACVGNGYGRVRFNRKKYLAHRLAWILAKGEIPDGLNVLHKCDVPSCVNVEHLFLGTQAENIDDMVKKNRRGDFRGSANGRARLNADKVNEIRALTKDRSNYADIAKLYGVHESSIGRIARNETWKHL